MSEELRLLENAPRGSKWHRWGPYLSERQWGTVREDYSAGGTAWDYFPHDHARMRAYRWGDDGLLGICDRHGFLCAGLSLWNGQDAILKERLFGLTNSQGNHGEDVKELYWFLDCTPTHAYMKALYKYPQAAFPYEQLVQVNAAAGKQAPEYELFDTGVFDDNRYFDVFVEYAKTTPNEILCRITVHNRGPEDAPIWVMPTFWFRNTWSWKPAQLRPGLARRSDSLISVDHPRYGEMWFALSPGSELVFCENESNLTELFGAQNPTPYVKDAFHRYVIEGEKDAVNPAGAGTKASAIFHSVIPAGKSAVFKYMLSDVHKALPKDFDQAFDTRKSEADEFYEKMSPGLAPDVAEVQRQAFAGMLWSKQYYHYDVSRWLTGDEEQPPPPSGRTRNCYWKHVHAAEVLSMPDTWEYPWFAAWDLAFHTIPFALIDPKFAKNQLILLLREWYQHPNGQIPAYEWNFSDVNPPVHAWAAWRIYTIERRQTGNGDVEFLQKVFHKLLLNFTWWVNRKDTFGNNVFEGGFLGLDNIGVFDRNSMLPDGYTLEQSDGTSWMALFCLNMLEISLELAAHDRAYEDVASKFFEHFMYVAHAMNARGEDGVELWDDEDGFYYDVLRHGDCVGCEKVRARTAVGLIPLFAVTVLEPTVLEMFPGFRRRMQWFLDNRPDLTANVASMQRLGQNDRLLLTTVRRDRLERVLQKCLDPNEFLSDHGVRSVSKYHEQNPYSMSFGGQTFTIDYEPGESTTEAFGGNSNWRGPIWFPLNYILIESLQKYDYYYGETLQVPMPTGGQPMRLLDVAADLEKRLLSLFLAGENGCRPFNGGNPKFDNDPNWKELIQFNEYFDANTGKGLGASHQTGWTGVIAKIIQQLYITNV